MREEYMKQKYAELSTNLSKVSSYISSLISTQNELANVLNNNLTVDKKKIQNGELDGIQKDLNAIQREITGALIPVANRKSQGR